MSSTVMSKLLLALLVWLVSIAAEVVSAEGSADADVVTTTAVSGDTGDTLEFPPIFVMNLRRSTERWTSAKKQMDDAGLQVNRFDAIDGRALSRAELQKVSTRMAMFLQPRGVLGCYLSHRAFWQMVVDRNYASAIIFEDDVRLVPDFKDRFAEHLTLLGNETYDVVMLGAIGRVHPGGKDHLGTRIFAAYIGGSRPIKQLAPSYYQPRRPAGTHAYLVSNEGARKLLKLCPKAVFHVDLDAWRHPSLVIRMFDPMLAFQTFESTSLTDMNKVRKGRFVDRLKNLEPIKRLEEWAVDPVTLQPWTHVFDEPLLQLGPGGYIITVERQFKVILWGAALSAICRAFNKRILSRIFLGSTLAFAATVRSLIWALMNWK